MTGAIKKQKAGPTTRQRRRESHFTQNGVPVKQRSNIMELN